MWCFLSGSMRVMQTDSERQNFSLLPRIERGTGWLDWREMERHPDVMRLLELPALLIAGDHYRE